MLKDWKSTFNFFQRYIWLWDLKISGSASCIIANVTLFFLSRSLSELFLKKLLGWLGFFINVSEPFPQRFSGNVSDTFLKNYWKRSWNASETFSAPLRVDIVTFQKPFWNVLETFLFWFLWFEWNVSETFLKRFLLCGYCSRAEKRGHKA